MLTRLKNLRNLLKRRRQWNGSSSILYGENARTSFTQYRDTFREPNAWAELRAIGNVRDYRALGAPSLSAKYRLMGISVDRTPYRLPLLRRWRVERRWESVQE